MKITPWKLTSNFPSLSLLGGIALLPLSAYGQSPSIVTVNDKSSLTIKTATDKTYFLWQSENLSGWSPIATYVVGDGTPKAVSIVPSEQSRMFYRFGIAPTNALNPDDTDGDGIENSREFSLRLDPNWINSVTDLATAEVNSRISGKTAANSLRIYNNYATNGASLVFERNPNCWINSIANKSCISPWNSYERSRRAGTLITPRHVIFCAHYDFFVPANYKIYFVTDAGAVVERTILRTKRHPNYGSPFAFNNDIVIGVLDEDVPSTIQCVKFFPNDWNDYLIQNVRTPSLRLNQHEEALAGDFFVGSIAQETAYHLVPTEQDRLNFYLSLAAPTQTGLYGGDSGNGGFLVINSQLVLTNVWTYGGAGAGTSVTNEKSFINTMIGQLDSEVSTISGYAIQELDLSQYMKLSEILPEFTPIGDPPPIVIDESDYPFLEE
jgi:hypothetical protein